MTKFLPRLEETLKPFDVRPHWGKQFAMRPDELRARYEKFDMFKQLVANYDPEGKFRNAFMRQVLDGV